MNPLLRLFEQINTLKRLPRTGWLLCGVVGVESLADHTCAVALISLFLSAAINQAPDRQGLDGPLDAGHVLQLALLHDLAESVLTDLPRRATLALGEEAKHGAEAQILAALLDGVPGEEVYGQLWSEYHAGSSPEARLVKDVDRLEMVHQALCYADRGHRGLDEFWQGHRWHYPLCRQLYEELVARQD